MPTMSPRTAHQFGRSLAKLLCCLALAQSRYIVHTDVPTVVILIPRTATLSCACKPSSS